MIHAIDVGGREALRPRRDRSGATTKSAVGEVQSFGREQAPQSREFGASSRELFEMGGPERLQFALTEIGETDAHNPMVLVIARTLDQAGCFGAVDEFDCAVVSQEEVRSDIGHARRTSMPPDGEEELVLGRCDVGGLGAFLTPAEEPAQAVAELEQRFEIGGFEFSTA